MSMAGKKTPKIDHTPSALLRSAFMRSGAGVHKDQKKKADPKQLRRDKSYKRDGE